MSANTRARGARLLQGRRRVAVSLRLAKTDEGSVICECRGSVCLMSLENITYFIFFLMSYKRKIFTYSWILGVSPINTFLPSEVSSTGVLQEHNIT